MDEGVFLQCWAFYVAFFIPDLIRTQVLFLYVVFYDIVSFNNVLTLLYESNFKTLHKLQHSLYNLQHIISTRLIFWNVQTVNPFWRCQHIRDVVEILQVLLCFEILAHTAGTKTVIPVSKCTQQSGCNTGKKHIFYDCNYKDRLYIRHIDF